jgi:hypothetical protein
MTLADLIRGGRKTESVGVATAILAIPATQEEGEGQTVARIATVAVSNPGDAKTVTIQKSWPGGLRSKAAIEPAMREWESEDIEPDRLWGRVAIQEPGGGTVEVDTPSGWTLTDWQAYAAPRPWVRRECDRRASQGSGTGQPG